MVYVDEFKVWPGAKRPFDKGNCHLTADDEAELHEFAEGIGMRRSWFQEHPIASHYDLTPGRREVALKRGAAFVPAREQARRRRQP